MTEYELISLLRETATTISQDFEFFITVTFAVIFVSYAVGEKLKRLPRIIISVLYLGSVALVLFRYQNLLSQVEYIVSSLRELDSGFPIDSNLRINFVSPIRQSLMVLGSLAAVYTIFKPVISDSSQLEKSENGDGGT